jgi:hypothetical protein
MEKDYIVIQNEAKWDAYCLKIFTVKAESPEQAIEDVKICEEDDPNVNYSQVFYEVAEIGKVSKRPRKIMKSSGG